eukprot:NODE_518_length_7331_cov_0.450913.p2 type:complete len:383 gc:universal NODE_518_length_7331_cov_0.450913:5912-4764(-)
MSKTFTVYHTEWSTYGRNYQISDLPIDYIPSISYAFVNVDQLGNVTIADPYATIEKRFTDSGVEPKDSWNESRSYYGNFNQLSKLKEAGKEFQVTLAIGGWTFSRHFSSAVLPQNQQNFARSIVDFCLRYPIFSGISIDWEYLSNDGVNYGNAGNEARKEDEVNFVSFLKVLRHDLQSSCLPYKISFCCTADRNKIKFNVKNISELVDELHVMTYDFHSGSWGENVCAHHSNTYSTKYAALSVEEAVDAFIGLGADPMKMMIGVATYSRGFANTNGPGTGASGGSLDKSWEDGVVDYKQLPLNGALEIYDEDAGASYSYDAKRRVFNSYDTPRSVKEKCRMVYSRNLKGVILWESSGDHPVSDPRSLIRCLHRYLILNDFSE